MEVCVWWVAWRVCGGVFVWVCTRSLAGVGAMCVCVCVLCVCVCVHFTGLSSATLVISSLSSESRVS